MIYELWARKEQEEEAEREAAYERALEKAFERLKQLKQRLKPLTGDFVTPADLRTKVVDAIKAATESIFVLVYTFTERQIVDALLAAHDRGVRVWVIVDLSQWKKTPRMQHAMTRLTQGSIPVRMSEGRTEGGLMHLKVMVVDCFLVVKGSYNYTWAASEIHHEELDISCKPARANSWTEKFGELWQLSRAPA